MLTNKLEIFNIADGTLKFDLLGDNSSAVSISDTVSGGETDDLVSQINTFSDVTGIKAYTAGPGGIILQKLDAISKLRSITPNSNSRNIFNKTLEAL